MPTPRPLKVFLCHASVDKLAVRKLYHYLRDRKMDPWLDAEKLLPGQNWKAEIPKALLSSDVIIICLSKNSVDKEGYVQKEIRFALDKALEMPEGRIFLIPARLEECALPESLSTYHYVNLFEEDGYRRLLKSLRVRAQQIGATNISVGENVVLPDAGKAEQKAADKLALETAERDAAEKAAREKAERDAIAKDAREKTERDAAEQIVREKAENEITERKKQEAIKKVVIEKSERETGRIVDEVIQKMRFRLFLSKFQNKIKLFFRIYFLPALILLAAFVIWYMVFYKPSSVNPSNSIPNPTQILLTPTSLPTKTSTPSPTETLIPDPTLGIGSTMLGKDGMTLLYVPAGEFKMGSTDADTLASSFEKPQHTVYLDAFWIDQTEVTNKQYATCVSANQCKPPSNTSSTTHSSYYGNSQFDDYPVIYVDWNQATTYCSWAGRRLPTEAEWEKAARGTDRRIYPWGNTAPNKDLLNFNSMVGDTTKAGSYETGKSFYGAYDMAGNVWEWVNDWYQSGYYATLGDNASNPQGPASGDGRVLRGGTWYYSDFYVRSAFRDWISPASSVNYVGFRCSRSLP